MARVRLRRRPAAAVLAVVAALVATAGAPAERRERDQVRARAACPGAEVSLRLRADKGRIRVDVELEPRSASRWSIVVVHERQIVARGSYRVPAGGKLELRRFVDDWYGSDHFLVRTGGGAHGACGVSATL